MDNTLKLIGDYGILAVFMAGIVLLFIKYIPSLINIWIERLKSKNAANDLIFSALNNSTRVIENNSKALDNNTEAMRKSSEHYDKINITLDRLNESFDNHDKRAEEMSKDLAVLKERKK